MCPEIDNPARCEIGAVIRFLHAEIISVAEIHRDFPLLVLITEKQQYLTYFSLLKHYVISFGIYNPPIHAQLIFASAVHLSGIRGDM
jgi:hypothetical protein